METTEAIYNHLLNLRQTRLNGDDNLTATIQMILTGQGGGKFILHIENGRITVEGGRVPNPDVTVTMSDEAYLSVINGEGDPMKMTMLGQIGVEGDRLLAMRLESALFRK